MRSRIYIYVSMGFFSLTTYGALPPSVMPGDASRSFEQAPDFLSTPQPVFAEEQKAAPVDEASQTRFILQGISIGGHDLAQESELAAVIAPYLGKEVSFIELQQVAQELTKHFREEGYILNQVVLPPQKIENGHVHFHVVEGYITNVEIKGDTWLAEGRIKQHIDRILKARPLTQTVYERSILLIDDLPGIEIKATLVPAKEGQEGTTLVLELRQKYLSLGMSVNNDGTKYIGPWQGQAQLSFNNLFHNNEAIRFGYGTAPTKNGMKLFTFGYDQALGSHGVRFHFTGETSRTHPSNALAALRMHGTYDKISLGLDYMIMRMKYKSLRAGLDFTLKNIKNETRLTDTRTQDRLRILSAHLSYDFSDEWMGQNLFNVRVSQGLLGLGSTAESSLTKSRNSGRIAFVKSNFLLMRNQMLPYNFRVQGVVHAQWAGRPLITAERFGIGGPPYNKTYPLSAFNGDSGFEAKVELGYIWREAPFVEYVMPYTYFAHGTIWNRVPEAGEKKKQSINGINIGVRSEFVPGLNGFVEYALPFKKNINNSKFNNKLYVGLSYSRDF